jgi:hypothetical protein
LHFTVEKGFFPEEPPSFFPFHSSAWLDRFGEGTREKRDMREFIRPIMISSIIFQIVIFPLATTAAVRPTVDPNSDDPYAFQRRANMSKILTVLEVEWKIQNCLARQRRN